MVLYSYKLMEVILMNTIRDARKELGKTQIQVAQDLGISYSMYVKIELGRRNPSIKTMKKMSNYFKKTVDELFFTTK